MLLLPNKFFIGEEKSKTQNFIKKIKRRDVHSIITLIHRLTDKKERKIFAICQKSAGLSCPTQSVIVPANGLTACDYYDRTVSGINEMNAMIDSDCKTRKKIIFMYYNSDVI